jgi:hypothetical protein
MAFTQRLGEIQRQVELLFFPLDFNRTVAYLQGYNVASNGGLFLGFDEWLVVEVGYGNNLMWYELVLKLAFPDLLSPRAHLNELGMQERAVKSLFNLLVAFHQERESHRGLFRIYLRHQQWLESQDWYDSTSPDYLEASGPQNP